MPGSLAAPAASSSMALMRGGPGSEPGPGPRARSPGSEGELEGERHPAGERTDVLLRLFLRLLLGLGHGDDDQILEHLDVRWIHDARIELDASNLPLTVHVD